MFIKHSRQYQTKTKLYRRDNNEQSLENSWKERIPNMDLIMMYSAVVLGFKLTPVFGVKRFISEDDLSIIEVHDLSRSTSWKELTDYYGAIEKHWKICLNCGIPGLGTGLHLEHMGSSGSMQPSIIPIEYLITRLAVIDVSYLSTHSPGMALSLEVALQWSVLKYDPREPTLVLFKFGWKADHYRNRCVCKIPGISYELAEWIAANLSHVVGVATDAPTLESDQTREMTSHTVSNVLGRNGIYMIENVYMRRKLPERGCMSVAMPLMMAEASYVPTRLTAFCPSQRTEFQVSLALRKIGHDTKIVTGRVNQVNLYEILN